MQNAPQTPTMNGAKRKLFQTGAPGTESPLGQQTVNAGSGQRSRSAPMLNEARAAPKMTQAHPSATPRSTWQHSQQGPSPTPPGPGHVLATPRDRCCPPQAAVATAISQPSSCAASPCSSTSNTHPPAATTWQRLPLPWPRRTSARPAPASEQGFQREHQRHWLAGALPAPG